MGCCRGRCHCCCPKLPKRAWFLMTLGTLLLVAGVVLAAYGIPELIEHVVRGDVQLVEGNFAYDNWKNPLVPLKFHVYFYNITNPHEIDTELIEIEEVGPYVYQEDQYKTDVVFNSNGTITYKEYKGYLFQPDKSVGPETDKLYVPNVGVLGISAVISGICDMLDFEKIHIFNCVCENLVIAVLDHLSTETDRPQEHFYRHVEVTEFVFSGDQVEMFMYLADCMQSPMKCIADMDLVDKIKDSVQDCRNNPRSQIFRSRASQKYSNPSSKHMPGLQLSNEDIFNKVMLAMEETALSSDGGLLPEYIPEGKFAMLYGSNRSKEGPFLIYDGVWYSEDFTHIVKYKNSPYLEFWGDWYCNQVNGTDGAQFAPYVEDDDVLYVFVTDVCRSLYFEFEKEIEIEEVGLKAKRFVLPERMASASNPENECFGCAYPGCEGDGAVDLSGCQDGAPIIMTQPHFYMSDPKFLEPFSYFKGEGKPRKEDHETALDIDYRTGTTLQAHKRVQINMFAKSDMPKIKILQNIKTLEKYPEGVVFPIMWFDETATIDEPAAEDFRAEVTRPIKGATSIGYILIGIGFVMDVATGVYIYFVMKRNRKAKSERRRPSLHTQDSRSDLMS